MAEQDGTQFTLTQKKRSSLSTRSITEYTRIYMRVKIKKITPFITIYYPNFYIN